MVVIVGGLGIAYKAGVLERVGRVLKASGEGSWTYATAGRTPVYWLTWQMIKQDPWLGRGLNTFGKDFFYFRAETKEGQSVWLLDQSGAFREVHNEYLQVWEELGLPGLIIFLFLLFSVVVVSIRRLRAEMDSRDRYWLGMLTIGVIFIAISCLAFFPLHLSVTASYVVLLFAGVRNSQTSRAEHAVQPSGIIRPIASGVLIVALAGLAWQAIRDWQANNEAGVAAFLIRSASSQQYRPAQKRVVADGALARLEKAEELSPEFREVHNLKGSVLMMLGRYEQAVESYKRGIEYLPSPELYTNLAAAYMALGKRQQAEECLTLALNYAPRYTKARQALKFLEDGN